jgi:hypothetical protein
VTVHRLRKELAAEYELPGRISLHRPNGEELGDIIAADEYVRLRYDENVAVANGAIAYGGRGSSSGGRRAFAAGGFAGGGSILNGKAKGGLGRGGNVRADDGEGGAVMGASANYPGGEVEAGESHAGGVIKNTVPLDAGETK